MEDGVIFPGEKESGQGVAGGVGSHHAGADEVDLAGLGPEGGQTAGVKSFWTDFGNDFEASVLAGCQGTLAVVNFRKNAAESPDVNGGGREAAILAVAVALQQTAI